MLVTHKTDIDVDIRAFAKAFASVSPTDFCEFWYEWNQTITNGQLEDIAKSWKGYSNSKNVFKRLLTILEYYELKEEGK